MLTDCDKCTRPATSVGALSSLVSATLVFLQGELSGSDSSSVYCGYRLHSLADKWKTEKPGAIHLNSATVSRGAKTRSSAPRRLEDVRWLATAMAFVTATILGSGAAIRTRSRTGA